MMPPGQGSGLVEFTPRCAGSESARTETGAHSVMLTQPSARMRRTRAKLFFTRVVGIFLRPDLPCHFLSEPMICWEWGRKSQIAIRAAFLLLGDLPFCDKMRGANEQSQPHPAC